ncbi:MULTISPECIES: hypothetical protein [unclassified Nostoc]|uniref:hypothetical protein n=1 Tax=unclassified Nostoc TaxID=2593658 RepID=UPI002633A727|nr:hypothetical protein [Nostoc sp. S13]MDF5735498.1 hypothetical protein [Nostoc sp. S13]
MLIGVNLTLNWQLETARQLFLPLGDTASDKSGIADASCWRGYSIALALKHCCALTTDVVQINEKCCKLNCSGDTSYAQLGVRNFLKMDAGFLPASSQLHCGRFKRNSPVFET